MSQEGKQKLPKLQVQHNVCLGILNTQVCIKIVKLLNQSNYRNKKLMTDKCKHWIVFEFYGERGMK